MRLRSEFLNVRKEGRSYGGRFLVLAVFKAEELDKFKVGFIVPKRVGNAVARNLVKRRLHGIVGGQSDALDPHQFIVTIARRGAAEQPFASLQKEWFRLARRAGLYRNNPSRSGVQLTNAAGNQDVLSAAEKASNVTRYNHG